MSVEAKLRDDICILARSLFDRGLAAGSTGNISARLPDGTILMSPIGSTFRELEPERLSKLNAAYIHIGGEKPSEELPLHSAFYATRPGTGAVVHLHSSHTIGLSILPDLDPDDVLQPLTPHSVVKLGEVKLLPYFIPGDPAIGDALRELGGEYSAVLLANHGAIVAGYDLQSTVDAFEELEEAAKVALLTRQLHPRALSPEQVADLRDIYAIG